MMHSLHMPSREDFTSWTKNNLGRNALSGEFLESYVSYICNTFANGQIDDVKVSQRKDVTGISGSSHNIDVLIEFRIAGINFRVAFECKDRKRAFNRDDVMAFCTKISDLSNTVGVFIAAKGYQSGALAFLDSKGIAHFDETSLPAFGKVISERFLTPLLPSERAIGEPFWAIMEVGTEGTTTGNWMTIAKAELEGNRHGGRKGTRVLPLFFARSDAQVFLNVRWGDDASMAVRGVRQSTLSFLTGWAPKSALSFCIVMPFDQDGQTLFTVEEITPAGLASRFLASSG